MRILILIPMWKRSGVVEIMLRNLVGNIQDVGHDFTVLAILCPYDPELTELERLCKEYGVNKCYYPNLPLGKKINAGLNYALSRFEFDYLMNFGSDDLIHRSIFVLYRPFFDQNIPVFGVNSLYFHDLDKGKTLFFRCYTDGLAVGAGRMINKKVIETLKNKGFELYSNELNRSLDSNSHEIMLRWAGVCDEIIESGEFPYIVDIKTNTNINHISQIELHQQQITAVDDGFLLKYYEL